MSKHTPGPWARGPKPENGMPLIVAPESNRVVLGYKEPNWDEEGWYVVDDYDLQLMLAAPDMLKELVGWMEWAAKYQADVYRDLKSDDALLLFETLVAQTMDTLAKAQGEEEA